MPQSHYKNIVRKLSNRFKDQLYFVHVTNKTILVYILSSGVEATGLVKEDLLKAQSVGQNACKEFVNSRCLPNPKLGFFDPLKKNSLKTFKDMKKVTKVKSKDIFDGMALLQKFKPPAGATFGVLAERILDILLNSSRQRIDVIFDVYKDVSIKNAERPRRTDEFSKGTRHYKIDACGT